MDYYIVNLTQYFCNKGISHVGDAHLANFTGMGSSYPAEQLPKSNQEILIQGVPFLFPPIWSEHFDNIELNGLTVGVQLRRYRKIHVLGASENGSFRCPVCLSRTNEERIVTLGLTDWTKGKPTYEEEYAFLCQGMHTSSGSIVNNLTCAIWHQQIGGFKFNHMEFIDNPSMHIFAITLEEEVKDGTTRNDAI